MRPKQREEKSSGDLFRARLDQIIDMRHELVRLADEIDWAWIYDQEAEGFSAAGRTWAAGPAPCGQSAHSVHRH